MKTVNTSFAECRRVASSSRGSSSECGDGSGDAKLTASDAIDNDDDADSSTSDLMEHFLSELDLVFSDILAEEVGSFVMTIDHHHRRGCDA